jgi:triosephosphate isomerase (TIM)
MKTPAIIVNFKTYEAGTGPRALEVAKICDELAQETGISIAVAVQATDIRMIADAVSIPVLAQHADGVVYGSNTGHIMPEALKQAGAYGTLLNHSEDQYEKDALKSAVEECKKEELFTIICAPTAEVSAEYAAFMPDMIAVEPPELIGTGVSVSTTQPELVTNTVTAVHSVVSDMTVLCGAGVVTTEDVSKAIELGAKGVLLASGVLKADNPREVMLDLIKGVKK